MKLIVDIPDEVYEHAKDYYNRRMTSDEESKMRHIIANGTPLDSIIADIEAARDKDKLCEYPYNRCINIIKKVVGDEN